MICARAAPRREVMAVGLALLGLAFSHPIGAAIAFAAMPFLVFAVRPALVANSALNVVVALVFPDASSASARSSTCRGSFPARLELLHRAGRKPLDLGGGVARIFGDGPTGLARARRRPRHGLRAGARRPARGRALVWVIAAGR